MTLRDFIGTSSGLLPGDGNVVVSSWLRATVLRVRAWMWPDGLAAAVFYVAASVAVLVRAASRERLWFTGPWLLIASVGGVLYVWRFYRHLPTLGYPVLLRVAVPTTMIPGFKPHLSSKRAIAPVTAVVLLPSGAGLGLVGKAGVYSLRQASLCLTVEAAPNGKVARAFLISDAATWELVAAGNLRRPRL